MFLTCGTIEQAFYPNKITDYSMFLIPFSFGIYCIWLIFLYHMFNLDISIGLLTISLIISVNNVFILINFLSILFIFSYELLGINCVEVTLLIVIMYYSAFLCLFLMNGFMFMSSFFFNYLYFDLFCFLSFLYPLFIFIAFMIGIFISCLG